MSSPLSSLKKGKRIPLRSGNLEIQHHVIRRFCNAPFQFDAKAAALETELINKSLKPKVSEHELMVLMTSRLTTVEKKLVEAEGVIKEKNKQIFELEQKCKLFEKSEAPDRELETKCYKLQKQVQDMEEFLEDYGMIWCGDSDSNVNDQVKWKPDQSISKFKMDFDLVIENLLKLNYLAGEGEHYIKQTKDGARFQMKEPVPLTLYNNGIFMFAGPFRPYSDSTTQVCMNDIMGGYFPKELKSLYPVGVPFKVIDKRDTFYKNKTLEKAFPGTGQTLSPDKSIKSAKDIERGLKVETDHKSGDQESVERFLSKLPLCTMRNGKIVDVREGLKAHLKPLSSKNDVVIVETDVSKEIKSRCGSGGKRRPKTPCNVTTLRIKSETGDQTFLLKMRYSQTIGELYCYLDLVRDQQGAYELKSSFPNQTFRELERTLKDCGLVPNATLHISSKTK